MPIPLVPTRPSTCPGRGTGSLPPPGPPSKSFNVASKRLLLHPTFGKSYGLGPTIMPESCALPARGLSRSPPDALNQSVGAQAAATSVAAWLEERSKQVEHVSRNADSTLPRLQNLASAYQNPPPFTLPAQGTLQAALQVSAPTVSLGQRLHKCPSTAIQGTYRWETRGQATWSSTARRGGACM